MEFFTSTQKRVAPTKLNERYEWFIEKATEIGVDIITPIFCNNSERKIIKIERYQKVLISAAKQALRMHFPILKEPKYFNEFIKTRFDGKSFIAHCQEKPKERLKNFILPQKNILLMIGPEGDFSNEEIKLAENLGFKSVSLGNSRLRTETAAIIACHTIKLFNE
jgi:16S rRNA (uracil1498-N3)-methyltransferase